MAGLSEPNGSTLQPDQHSSTLEPEQFETSLVTCVLNRLEERAFESPRHVGRRLYDGATKSLGKLGEKSRPLVRARTWADDQGAEVPQEPGECYQ